MNVHHTRDEFICIDNQQLIQQTAKADKLPNITIEAQRGIQYSN